MGQVVQSNGNIIAKITGDTCLAAKADAEKIRSGGNWLTATMFLGVAKNVARAGGGATIDSIFESARNRIQDFANKYNTEVAVVGSRAKKLPKGKDGGEMGSGQDFLDGPIDPNRPHIIFTPQM